MEKIETQQGVFSKRHATRILPWVLQAVRRLTITQLRQALVIDTTSGALRYDRIPSEEDTLRSCANLIGKNQEQQVILAHHSARPFLEDSINEYAEATASLYSRRKWFWESQTLAELCILHLNSESYSLALQPFVKGPILRLDPPVINRITITIPWYVRSFLTKVQPV